MVTVIIEGWKEGLNKVELTNLQCEILGLSLFDSKTNTDKILDGEIVRVIVENVFIAEEFVKKANYINVISRYDVDI